MLHPKLVKKAPFSVGPPPLVHKKVPVRRGPLIRARKNLPADSLFLYLPKAVLDSVRGVPDGRIGVGAVDGLKTLMG